MCLPFGSFERTLAGIYLKLKESSQQNEVLSGDMGLWCIIGQTLFKNKESIMTEYVFFTKGVYKCGGRCIYS